MALLWRLVGAELPQPCQQLADKVGPWVTVIMGAIFVICVLAFRRGLVGELLALRGNKSPPQGH